MKALVLAGGVGSRLLPIGHTSTKQLVPVANKPVLFYGLEAIRDAGIHEVGIVVCDAAHEIEEAVGDGSGFGLDVTYLPQDDPRGLAHAVLNARDYLGDDDFVMYLGDNFVGGGINDLVDRFRRVRPDAQIMLTTMSEPCPFGVAGIDAEGRVIGVAEKPSHPDSDLALTGVYVFSAAVHEAVAELKPSWRNELEITDAIQWLIEAGHRVESTVTSSYWRDTGDVTDMLELNRVVLEGVEPSVAGTVDTASELIGRVVVEPGATVSGSRVVGPVIVGAGAVIRNSYVGPFTSIDRDCTVIDSEIEHSIVLRGAFIAGIGRIDCSLIGRDTRVTPAPRVRKAHRLVLGDHSEVQVGS